MKAPAQSGIPSDIIQSLLNDESGNIWIGRYDQSPLKYNLKTLTAKPIMSTWPYGVVKVIEPAASGELWVATESNGLISFTIENGTWKANTFDPSQRKTRISALHCDQEFNLWIGSPDQGLQSTNLLFSFLEASVPNAQAIYSLPDGNFLVGTAKGLFLQSITDENISQIRKIETPLPLNIVSIAQDQYGNIWLGTFGNYVFVYQPSSNKFRQIGTRDGLNNESILSMYTKGNSVWMATLGGVFQIDLDEDPMLQRKLEIKNLHAEKAIGTSFIYQVTGDQLGNIWFATDGKGIASMRDGKIQQYPNALVPNTKTVYSIAIDSKGSVWMGTGRNGLYEFKNDRLIPHGSEQGLRNTEISMLIKDKLDRILVVHPEGIDRYDPTSKQFSYYDQESGLKAIQPNINAFAIDKNNTIWIGTQQGLLKYQVLQELTYKPAKPGLALLNVLNMQEPVLGKASNEFKHQENFLTFQFQGSWYSNPSLIRYRYRLIGQDLQWRYTRDMEVNYSNLSPGKYEFEIQVSISNQFINAPKETYAFVINPPFYANPWFALLLITSFGGVVYYLIKQRERTLRQRAKLQKERIEFQFNSLKNQINPHFLFNSLNTLTALIEENSSAAVSYVENLSDFYRSILQFGETDLITLKEELELVRNFIFLVDQRFTGNLHIDIDIEDEGGLVPPLALQMLVENAIKHNIISKARPLSVRIYDREDKLWVTNTLQRKAKPEKSSGIGLQNILCRYRLLGKGQVVVEENEQQFIVGIPRIVDFPKI